MGLCVAGLSEEHKESALETGHLYSDFWKGHSKTWLLPCEFGGREGRQGEVWGQDPSSTPPPSPLAFRDPQYPQLQGGWQWSQAETMLIKRRAQHLRS